MHGISACKGQALAGRHPKLDMPLSQVCAIAITCAIFPAPEFMPKNCDSSKIASNEATLV